ncbi:MAG: T9SS type A sorting domain-containing protein, partial [Bacteroidetes bacterium]|nr:T9SS type A sorting domain-containing protein [Bacteroidota bacterium]
YLVKTDSAGNVVWAKTFYGGKQYDAVGMSVQQTVDSGYVVGGYVRFSNNDLTAAYLIKTDKNGDSLWAKTYDGALYDNAFSVQQTNDGGYIVAGQTKSFGAGMNDAWLIKTDANGDTLWTKTYGRSGNDVARSVQQTTDGGYIITGQTDGYGVWLIKTDSMGNAPPLKLSVSEVSTIQINFRVYPNPTTDGVTIDLGGEYKKTSIEITNINGEQISKTNYINARLIQLNVDAPTGVYLITVVSDSVVSTVKLVKE